MYYFHCCPFIHLETCMCMKILIGFVPKQQEYSLWKSLEVVVAINGQPIHHRNLPEHLNHKQHKATSQINILAFRFCTSLTYRASSTSYTDTITQCSYILSNQKQVFNLHPNDCVDEEEHGYQQSDIRQGLRETEERQKGDNQQC